MNIDDLTKDDLLKVVGFVGDFINTDDAANWEIYYKILYGINQVLGDEKGFVVENLMLDNSEFNNSDLDFKEYLESIEDRKHAIDNNLF